MIKRNCLNFNDPSTIKSLYSSLIRPHLEYGSIIWETWTLSHYKQIEEVQNKVLRYISHKCNIFRLPHSGYDIILNKLNLKTLKDRRQNSYSIFLNKLLNNEIDDSFILSHNISFKINNHNIRNKDLFFIPHYSKNCMSHSPINILLSAGNTLNSNILFL